MSIESLKKEIHNRKKLIKNNNDKRNKTLLLKRKINIFNLSSLSVSSLIILIELIIGIKVTIILTYILRINLISELIVLISDKVHNKRFNSKQNKYFNEINTLENTLNNLEKRNKLIDEIDMSNNIVRDIYEITYKDRIVNFETNQKIKKL